MPGSSSRSAFAVTVMAAGVRSTSGVLIVPLEEEFHWSRATISFALGINLLLFGAIGPFAAALMDRFGARRTITLALATAAVSVVLTPAMSQPWQLVLLWGVVVGLVHRLRRWVSGGIYRRALVPGAGRVRCRPADCGQCRRSTGLSADDGVPRDPFRLADHVAGLGRCGDRVSAAPGPADAQPTRGCRASALWRPGHIKAGRLARGQSGYGRLPRAGDGSAITRLLADCRRLFRLRSHDQWPDRHASDRRLRRSWTERGRRGRAAGRNRRLRSAWRHARGVAQR